MSGNTETYIPLLPTPFVQGDSLTRPYVVGRIVDLGSSPHDRLDGRNLPHFVAKNDLSEWRPEPANDSGKGVDSVLNQGRFGDFSTSRNISDASGKYKRFMPVAQVFASMSKYPGTGSDASSLVQTSMCCPPGGMAHHVAARPTKIIA